MKIVIQAESANEEFTEFAVAMELRDIADQVSHGQRRGAIYDPWSGVPGKVVGSWELTP